MSNGNGPQDPGGIRALIEQRRQARGGRFGAAARGIGQGFTVGLSDEMMGVARGFGAMWPGGMTPGEGYTAGTEGARERNRASREAYPWTYGAGEVAGAVAPMVGAALITAPAGGAGGAAVAGSTGARLLAAGANVARGSLCGRCDRGCSTRLRARGRYAVGEGHGNRARRGLWIGGRWSGARSNQGWRLPRWQGDGPNGA